MFEQFKNWCNLKNLEKGTVKLLLLFFHNKITFHFELVKNDNLNLESEREREKVTL